MDAAAERARFRELQAGFATTYPRLAADSKAPRTVVVLPSLSLDAEVMARISGVHHYEERMLGGITRSSQHRGGGVVRWRVGGARIELYGES